MDQCPNTPRLVGLQEKNDKIHKEMLLYKYRIIELKGKIVELENDKVEWVTSKGIPPEKNK